MQQSDNSAPPLILWNYPRWAKAFGIVLFVMGLLDYMMPPAGLLGNPGFFLVMAGIAVSVTQLDKAGKNGASWLVWSFLAWGMVDFLAVFFHVIAAGITRSFLTNIAFRSPSWTIFGLWLFYAGNITCRASSGVISKAAAMNDARAVFRFSVLLLGILVFFTGYTVVSMQVSDNQTVEIWPLSAEFMTRTDTGAGFGKIGFFQLIQSVVDEETGIKTTVPWLGFWWFPAQLLLLPLTWFFAGRFGWKKLAVIFALGLIALLSIPVQLSFQYGLKAFGADGFLAAGYYIMFIPLLVQAWGFKLVSTAIRRGADPKQVSYKVEKTPFPAGISLVALVIVVIWTFSLPTLQRSPIDRLIHASRNNQSDRFPALLEAVKRNIKENPVEVALCKAIDEKEAALVAWLLTLKPNLDKKPERGSNPPLWWAIRGDGRLELTEMLLKAGADPNKDLYEGSSYSSGTPLGLAIDLHAQRKNGIEYLRLLAKFGADLNQPINQSGDFPLEKLLGRSTNDFAADYLKEFVALGGDPLRQNPAALFRLALNHRDGEILKYLMSLGISSIDTDKNGNSFLHAEVARVGFNQRFSLSRKAEQYAKDVINMKNHDGLTALHLAVEKNHAAMVEELMNLGADPHISSDEGLSAIDLARSKNMLRLVSIMESGNRGR